MNETALLVLKIFLVFFVVYSLIKFMFFFFIKYDRRRKLLDLAYKGKTSGSKIQDIFFLAVILILLGLLFVSGAIEYISFITGLLVGMILIQLYFHRFSQTLTPAESPEPPISAIKMMSYAIEANPGRAWKELLIMTILFIWAIYTLLTQGFGL